MNKKKITILTLIIIFIVLGLIYIIKINPDFFKILSSRDKLQAFINDFGPLAPIIYVFIQALQVLIAPIPGNVTALVGGALFGLWQGFFLSVLGLLIGSLLAFSLAKTFGRPLVEKFVKKETVDKYIDVLSSKYLVFLFILFLFPFFPDDALCFIAGITSISYPLFIIIVLIARPPGMLFTALVGSGTITVSPVGWILIVVVSAAFIFLSYKYKDNIEDYILKKFYKNKK